MFIASIQRYKKIILTSILFFYLGCVITLSAFITEYIESHAAVPDAAPKPMSEHLMEGVEYVALILSSPDNKKQRNAIRMTWINLANNIEIENGKRVYRWNQTWSSSLPRHSSFVKSVFAVGTQGLDPSTVRRLESESARKGDLILLGNVEDSYSKLTHKMSASLHWLDKHARQLKYVVKCDDDSFVRLDLIVSELEARGHDLDVQPPEHRKQKPENDYRGLYWGYFGGERPVFQFGKWKEQDWFLCDKYIPFAFGGGYVLSRSIVSYVAANIEFLQEYHSEDTSMGLWTAALSGINRVHDSRFFTEFLPRGCHDDTLVRHKRLPKSMVAMYSTLVQSRGKNLCKKEKTLRNPYVYNWNVLPQKCCKVAVQQVSQTQTLN